MIHFSNPIFTNQKQRNFLETKLLLEPKRILFNKPLLVFGHFLKNFKLASAISRVCWAALSLLMGVWRSKSLHFFLTKLLETLHKLHILKEPDLSYQGQTPQNLSKSSKCNNVTLTILFPPKCLCPPNITRVRMWVMCPTDRSSFLRYLKYSHLLVKKQF